MAQLKEIRSRITSVKNTHQVTSAMKMVSAAKLKKSQDAIMQIRPYVNELSGIMNSLALDETLCHTPFCTVRPIEQILIVVVGSNKGLCGGFNAYVVKEAIRHVVTNYYREFMGGGVKFIAIGRQVEKELRHAGIETESIYHDLIDKECNYEHVSVLTTHLMDLFQQGDIQRVALVHNVFKNAAVQIPTVEQYLPVAPPQKEEAIHRPINYLFEPTAETIVSQIVPKILRMRLFATLLDSIASEHGARMTSMHQATDNAVKIMKDLKMIYNNARQAAITNEIIEITAGAEALRK